MPTILNGGLSSVGIWPRPDHEDLGQQQAVYVTMIKRHFDAICVASVVLGWPDQRIWVLYVTPQPNMISIFSLLSNTYWKSDGSWGRASNMSWYYSYVFSSDRRDDGSCFWLDHRGDLKHKKDLQEEYVTEGLGKGFGKKPDLKNFPAYLWAAEVIPEAGIPEGEDLNEGMRENGVHEYKVPLGVKFRAPAFLRSTYGADYDNLTLDDFVTNPGRIRWITEPTRKNVRGGNEALPIFVSKL